MLGPSLGYALASLSLEIYIAPKLTPTIDKQDPRWMGAWWMGWVILSVLLAIGGALLAMFPRVLPKAAARKAAKEEVALKDAVDQLKEPESKASFSGKGPADKTIPKGQFSRNVG